jgi:hypothetical protein
METYKGIKIIEDKIFKFISGNVCTKKIKQ